MSPPPCIAIYLYEPSDGGLDRVAILLANHLVAGGFAAELWMARTDGPLAPLIASSVPIRRIPGAASSRQIGRGLDMARHAPALRGMVRKYKPAVLYSAGNQSNLLVALATLGTPTRAVGRISNPIIRPGSTGMAAWMRRKRFQITAELSDLTIVMGEADRVLLAGRRTDLAKKIAFLPRPTVSDALLEAGRSRVLRSAGQRRELLAVGRLAHQKDYPTMLAALSRLVGHDWRLRIAGQGPLRAELEQLCRKLGIADRVEFLGFVEDPAELAHLYASSEILLQTSLWEGLGASWIEALACGCGVVITDCHPDLRRILEQAGQHPPVRVGDAPAFAAAIAHSLDVPSDPDRTAEAVRPFTMKAGLAAYQATLAELAGMAKAAPSDRPKAP